ncbi:MAG TPA: energy transducer TonB [Flavobacteriales bacterium]|nr:energy transducer TonB [Flavobacteriales bacterium]
MHATAIIGGATLVAVASVYVGFSSDDHQACCAQVKAAVPFFDPFQPTAGASVQEPWLDPLVFNSNKAYVVEALTSKTTAPTTDALFVGGADSLVSYLKGNILPHIQPGIGWLKPPVVHFTLDKGGDVTDVSLAGTSGKAELDAHLLQVITDMPRWTPAKDANGGAMEQAFAFRVVQGGCAPASR